MRTTAYKRTGWIAALALTALAVNGADRLLSTLIDSTLKNGPDSRVPSHLSVVLGISPTEKATPVKQAVNRTGGVVHTLNVCTGNHDRVVLLAYDEQRRATKAYLMSADGVLLKAVSYDAGAPAALRPADEARADFTAELNAWKSFLRKPNPPR